MAVFFCSFFPSHLSGLTLEPDLCSEVCRTNLARLTVRRAGPEASVRPSVANSLTGVSEGAAACRLFKELTARRLRETKGSYLRCEGITTRDKSYRCR